MGRGDVDRTPVGRGGVVDRTSDSQSREPRIESSYSCFEACEILFTPCCSSCINKYLAIDSGGYVNE